MMQMGLFKSVGAMVITTAILSFAMACGDSSPADGTGVAVEGRDDNSFNWGVIFNPTLRTIKIGSGVGYCVGDPRPRIMRPDIKYRGDDVYIRLELKRPPPSRPSRNGPCRGVELLVTRTINLRRDLSDLRLYDSGVEPPELRWPR